jgi:3-deoxy-manno-octulosonate cytidylyltransferase (CMP-KDO synthetase)
MLHDKKIVCVIPARLKSTRFPRKMLTRLHNKPLLQWVWEAANRVSLFDEVTFAIDSDETAALIDTFQGKYVMTSEQCQSGTERLIELVGRKWSDADIWVNWQGDEPFIHEAMIHNLLQTCAKEHSDVWTLCKKITQADEIHNPHVAKVVCDAEGYALNFSRSTIPYYRDPREEAHKCYYKHVGLYAFTREALLKMATLSPCYLEEAEQLEQLRFLYHRLKVRVHETESDVFGIDLPEHLIKAEKTLTS